MAGAGVRVARRSENELTVASGLRGEQFVQFSEGSGVWCRDGNIFHNGFVPLALVVDDVVGR